MAFQAICARSNPFHSSCSALLIFFNDGEYNRTETFKTTAEPSIAVHVVHVKLCILDEVIVRELDAVKIAVLKHHHILPETTRRHQQAKGQYSADYNVFR